MTDKKKGEIPLALLKELIEALEEHAGAAHETAVKARKVLDEGKPKTHK